MANCTCIKLKTVDQRLTIVQQPVLSSGDVGTVRVEYELDSYWEGYTPSGTFYTGKQPEDVYEQPLVGGACVVPWEVLQEDGVLFIGLRGVDEAGLIKTAAPVRYRVEKGSPCGTGTTTEPTPDVYRQILAVAGAAYDVAQSVKESADAGEFNPSSETISELVVAELADRGQLNSEFVQSTEEMTDPAKLYILPDMHIYAARKYEVRGEPLFTNLADPTDVNWAGGHQLTEEGQVVGAPGYAVTNILELNAVTHDVIRIRGLGALDGFAHTLCLGEDGTTIEDAAVPAVETSTHYSYNYDADTGEVRLHVLDPLPVGGIEIYKFRTSGKLTGTAADVVITLNEYIGYAVAYEYEWYDTGYLYSGQEGPAGPAGPAGAGVYIQSVETSLLPGGTNLVTFSDGTILPVQNGENGAQGRPGNDGIGVAGVDGVSATHSWDGTVLTVTSASGTSSADLIGPAGPAGPAGANGYTPQKDVDYWNDADKAEVKADISAEVAEQLADKVQLEPEFAESLEELEANGDTSKLYVLPDGYIYAYVKREGVSYTNQLPTAKDTDLTTVYNGVGYITDKYLSGGWPSNKTGYNTTGLMPIGIGSTTTADGEQVIYLKNIEALPTDAYVRVALYKADGSYMSQQSANGFKESGDSTASVVLYSLDENGYIKSIDVTRYTAYVRNAGTGETAYFRICAPGIDGESIITVNEKIEEATAYRWDNTGHAFVPADYEDRIIDVEEKTESNSNRLGVVEETLKGFSPDTEIPVLVKEGASVLVDKALSREDSRVIRFLVNSDAHQKNDHELITKGTKELAQAHKAILSQIGVDFVANLGDMTWGASGSGNATVLEEGKAFNKLFLDCVRGQVNLWVEGNHETESLTASQIYGLIYANNKGIVQDTAHLLEGYGYMDFPNQKVRVICLNTNQGTASGSVNGMSNEQLKWFAETALDMSNKTDWSVITLGHHPLSYNTVSLFRYAAETVKAFINGDDFSFTTNDGFTFGINYSGKNCQYVGHFHGHAHAFSVVKMQRYVASNEYEELDAWEICIPNACYTRNNQYKGNGTYTERYSTETTYDKTDVDGQRTSFNLVTVCLDDKIIYADNFGAGIDRVINY